MAHNTSCGDSVHNNPKVEKGNAAPTHLFTHTDTQHSQEPMQAMSLLWTNNIVSDKTDADNPPTSRFAFLAEAFQDVDDTHESSADNVDNDDFVFENPSIGSSLAIIEIGETQSSPGNEGSEQQKSR